MFNYRNNILNDDFDIFEGGTTRGLKLNLCDRKWLPVPNVGLSQKGNDGGSHSILRPS